MNAKENCGNNGTTWINGVEYFIIEPKFIDNYAESYHQHKLSEITEEEFYKALTYTQRITTGDEVQIEPTRFKRTPEQVWEWILSKLTPKTK